MASTDQTESSLTNNAYSACSSAVWEIDEADNVKARYARLTPSCNHPRNFITIASKVLEICTGQKISMKINKGQKLSKKTQKLSKQELGFMGTALPLDEIYSPTKFHNHS